MATLILAAVYYAAAKLALRLAFLNPSVTPVWPPTGIAIAALMLLGLRVWPGVLLGAFLANVTTAGTTATSSAIAVGNCLEALVGASLAEAFARGRRAFERPREVLVFAALAGGLATTIAATVGVTSLALEGFVEWSGYGPVWLTWWLGDMTGALLVTPLLVLWAQSPYIVWDRRRTAEAVLLVAGLLGTGAVLFGGWSPLPTKGEPLAYLATPIVLWAALRFGPRETATVTVGLAAMALGGTVAGFGPFAGASPNSSLLLLQPFMGVVAGTGLLLAAAVSQHQRSEAEARRLSAELATRVDVRTRELQAATAELIRSGERYRSLMESAPDALLVSDKAGKILLVNARAEQILGYRREELIGRAVEELILWRDPEGRERRRAEPFEERSPRTTAPGLQLYGRRRDGSEFPVEISLGPVGANGDLAFCVAIRDVSERRKAEEALRESQAALERAQSVAHVGSWLSGVTADAPLEWSKETYRIFGVDEGRFGGRVEDFYARVHPDDVAAVSQSVRTAVAERAPYAIDHRIVRPDGSVRWVHEQAEVIRDDEGRPVRLIGTVQDITEMRQLQEQLLQSQKIEAVGRLAGGIAHDFNNLLGVIEGYSDLALKDLGPDHRARRRVREIQKAGERAATLTRQLLAFSRKQVLQPKVVDLNGITADIEGMLRRLIGEHIELVTELDPNLWLVKADPAQIEQVILNLAVNSRDAMPDGGRLILKTASVELDKAFVDAHPGASPGPHVMLAVSDTGHGMEAQTLSHVFEPFFTTKPPGKGTGLGLVMVYGIVKQSGGYVDVQSEAGKGTTFKVYLPRVEASAAEPTRSPDPVDRPSGAETILLVEDDLSLRGVVREVLAGAGYEVLEGSSPEEALITAANSVGRIDLLLTDVVMPGSSGDKLAGRLRAVQPGIRVLYVSGYTEDAISHHGVLAPGTHYLQKPFRSDTLLRAVRRALDEP